MIHSSQKAVQLKRLQQKLDKEENSSFGELDKIYNELQ